MDDRTMTLGQIDELLRFLPLFEVPERRYTKTWAGGEETPDGAITMPFPVYMDDVLAFFHLAGQPHWSDYNYEPRESERMLRDEDFIQTCSLGEFRTMLTYCVRGERFCDGHWEHLLESGKIVALLRRLATLRDTLKT